MRAWGIVYGDIDFIYPIANQPNFGYATLVLGNYGVLSEERKTEIRLEIEVKMAAGSRLFVKQAEPQLIDFTITADLSYRADIQTVLTDIIKSSNADMGAQITIAQIHAQIDTITNDYTLTQPVSTVEAADDNYLKIGAITWQ